jgi:phage tail-like protein
VSILAGVSVAGAAGSSVAKDTGLDTAAANVTGSVKGAVVNAADSLATSAKSAVEEVVGSTVVNAAGTAAKTAAKAASAAAAELRALWEYPPVAFYFYVSIDNNLFSDNAFQEVSGISTEIETEPLIEGGNQYVYHLPTKIKRQNLVLTRGSAAKDGKLVKWCKSCLETNFASPIVTKKVSIYLMNEMGLPIQGWDFINAYPVKWEFESFNSTKNEVAIERIELCYASSSRVMG